MNKFSTSVLLAGCALVVVMGGCGPPKPAPPAKLPPSPTTSPIPVLPPQAPSVPVPFVPPPTPAPSVDRAAIEKSLEERISQLDKKIDELGKKIDELGDKADVAMKDTYATLREQRKNFDATWKAVKEAAADAWEKAKETAGTALDALDKQLDKLNEKLKS